MKTKIIVSRHEATIKFIKEVIPGFETAPVREEVTKEEIRGKEVAGNTPLNLAAEAEKVHAVIFDGKPPRGEEVDSIEGLKERGVRIETFKVTKEGRIV